MVSRHVLILAFCFCAFAGCGAIAPSEPPSNIADGSALPIIVDVQPASASGGDSVTILGAGFSYAAAENVISVGGTSTVADNYEVTSDGSEALTFTVPQGATEGDTDLLVITDGNPSNTFAFTVLPPP